MSFIPLNIKTCYSFLESGLSIKTIIHCAKKYNFKTLGISDNSNFFAFPFFVKECEKNNIKPILGNYYKFDEYIVHYIIKNNDGYFSLLKINELHRNKNLTVEEAQKYSKGLIAIINLEENKIEYDSYFENNKNRILKDFVEYSKLGEEFYFGYDCPDTSYLIKDKEHRDHSLIKLLIDHTYQFVLFPLINLYQKKDKPLISILEYIKNQEVADQFEDFNYSGITSFEEMENIEGFFKEEEMSLEEFKIIKHIDDIVSKVNFNFFQKRGKMVSITNGENPTEVLRNKCIEGLKNKFNEIPQNYLSRLDYELKVISSLHFDDYFLIVEDYVNFARKSGIYVGPGRGSAGGSLVSFALNITEVDPLKYDLYFERFLSKSRSTMPDIDIDFEDTRRKEVVDYLKNKYNSPEQIRVSNIITFQTFKTKQALRDVSKVIGYLEDNKLPKILGAIRRDDEKKTIPEIYESNNYFKSVCDEFINSENYEETKHLLHYASLIEGFPRQAGQHAAGVILNEENLSFVLPLYNNSDTEISSEITYEYLEEMGFLKMDILSLINLSEIHEIIDLVNKNHNTKYTLSSLPIDDLNAIKLIREGFTNKIFQLENPGMIEALRKIRPDNFYDVSHVISIHRPGAKDEIDSFANYKHGKISPNYLHPILKSILESTYGVIIYQEQIMQIVSQFAGLSLEESDNFRKAISKKKADKLASLEETFMKGTNAKNIDPKIAKQIYDSVFKFAGYGFSKIHAIEYTMLATKMAFLKANYSKEFFTIFLDRNCSVRGKDFFKLIKDLNDFHIDFGPANINEIETYTKIKENKIYFSLECIPSCTRDIMDAIVTCRQKDGPYKGFDDFIVRLAQFKLPGAFVKDLINIGAFDFENNNRNYFLNRLKTFLDDPRKDDPYVKRDIGMLLELEDSKPNPNDFEMINPINSFLNEFYSMKFMFNKMTNLFPSIAVRDYKEIGNVYLANPFFSTCGLITSLKVRKDKNQKQIARITLLDHTGEEDFMIFNDRFEPIKDSLKEGQIIKINGRKSIKDDRGVSYIISNINTLY